MGHYTVLVAIDPTDPKRPDLETALAPFDENTEVEPYRKYETGAPADYWSWEKTPDSPAEPTWTQVVEFHNAKYDDDPLHVDDDGRAYVLSTYNPTRFGLLPLMHVEGGQARQSARPEVLFEVRDNQALGGVSEGGAVARRSIHVLLSMHEGTEFATDTRAAAALAHPAEVRDYGPGVRGDGGSTARPLRNLPGTATVVHDGGRPLPLDGGSSGLALSELQHGVRLAARFSVRAGSSSELPAAPAGYTWGVVAGSKWDWWTVGGRWTGWFRVRPEYVGHGDVINGEPGLLTEANTDEDWCDGGPKRVLDFKRTRDWRQVDEALLYSKFHKLIEGTPDAELWSSFIAQHEADKDGYSIKQARREYHAQPRVQALRDTEFDWSTSESLERFQRPREEVLARAAACAVPGFATLTLDGQWKEPGKMGWFGMSTDTPESQDEYYAWANEYVDSLDDEIVLVIVDVHI